MGKGKKESNGYSRRDFLKIVGATTGVAAVGCAEQPVHKAIPYISQPEEVIPGVATWYSGVCSGCSAGCGVVVRTREGRVVKVEGNPVHPINHGGLCARGQATVQQLYNPDRVREPLKREASGNFAPVSWPAAIEEISTTLSTLPAGKQAVLLTHPLGGSLKTLVKEFVSKFAKLRHVEFEVLSSDVQDLAAETVFGVGARTSFDFSKADVVVSFGADYLETWLSPVEFARQWATRRRPENEFGLSYVAHVEPRQSLTGANADNWIMNAPGSESLLLAALLKTILERGAGQAIGARGRALIGPVVEGVDIQQVAKQAGVSKSEIDELATRLIKAENSLVVAGGAATSGPDGLNAAVLSQLINVVLGNVGTSVMVEQTGEEAAKSSYVELQRLVSEMASSSNNVSALIIAGPNPSYHLSRASGFDKALGNVPLIVSIASGLDETATSANFVLPLSTYYESWSDSEVRPGLFNLNQPAMQPLYKTQALGDTLIALAGKLNIIFDESVSFHDYIRAQWKQRVGMASFENKWLKFVEQGGDWSGRETDSVSWSLSDAIRKIRLAAPEEQNSAESSALSFVAYPSVNFFDGRAANSPWLQEIPDAMTSAVWGSWVEMNHETAARMGLSHGSVVTVKSEAGALNAPLYLRKEIHPDLVAVPMGQGHEALGRYANGVGANAFSLLPAAPNSSSLQFLVSGVSVTSAPWDDKLVETQLTDVQLNRNILSSISHTEYKKLEKKASAHNGHDKHEEDAGGHHGTRFTLGPQKQDRHMYKQMEHPLYRWAMTVDLGSCTGCSACVAACYAENNVPVVGKDLVAEGREMSWIRIERYRGNDEDSPISGFMPVMCQQCGNAPCEPVCPVYATYHSDEGINQMVYNRCVGTRYCGNNCSYKARRYNWFKYDFPEPLNWQLNPDVTVRGVGVMEKCNFCVQRIREAQNNAKNEGRKIRDGEIKPACASSCPTQAITFGNLLDQESDVYHNSQSIRGYKLLDFDLNTQPAVTYAARVKNDTKVT